MLSALHRCILALGLGALLAPLTAAQGVAKAPSLGRVRSLYLNYDEHPPAEALLRHDLCILDPRAVVDLQPVQQRGHRVLAYVSLVELAEASPLAEQAAQKGVTLAGKNADWASSLMEVTTPTWREFILEDVAAKAMQLSFDGLFLDTVDSLERLPGKSAAQLAARRRAIIEVVQAMHQRWPSKALVINRGFALLPALSPMLSGVLVESVCQGFDPATGKHRAVVGADFEWMQARLAEVKALRLPLFAVDYVEPKAKALARETAKRLRALGCVPMVTTPKLNGVVLGH